jgi:lipopolysaccharide export system permease protein
MLSSDQANLTARAAPHQSRKKVLFITNTRLGDAVLTTGLLSKVIERFWPCDVTIACGPTPAPLFTAVPGLKRIIILDRKEKHKAFLRLLVHSMQFYWDAVVDIQNSFVSYLVPRKRVFRNAKMNTTEHKCVQLARVMKLAKVPDGHIWLSDAARKRAQELLPEGAPVLALCPTAGAGPKMWPAERFIELAQRLPFKRAAIFAAEHERDWVMPIVAALRGKMEVIDLAGKTDTLEAAACLARSSVCVANDSGLMHLSAAMGIPTLGIFGASSDLVYGPHGPITAAVRGAPYLGKKYQLDLSLIRAVSVDSVVDAAKKLIERKTVSCSAAAT